MDSHSHRRAHGHHRAHQFGRGHEHGHRNGHRRALATGVGTNTGIGTVTVARIHGLGTSTVIVARTIAGMVTLSATGARTPRAWARARPPACTNTGTVPSTNMVTIAVGQDRGDGQDRGHATDIGAPLLMLGRRWVPSCQS